MSSEVAQEWLNIFILVVVLAFIYFLPAYVASRRDHKNKVPILVINLFLGWSGIFWVIALAWAFSSNIEEG